MEHEQVERRWTSREPDGFGDAHLLHVGMLDPIAAEEVVDIVMDGEPVGSSPLWVEVS